MDKEEQTSKPAFKKEGKRDSLRRKQPLPEISTEHTTSQKHTPNCAKSKERCLGNQKRHAEFRHEKHEKRKNHRHDDRRGKEPSTSSDKKYSKEKHKKKREKELDTNTDQRKLDDNGTKSVKKRRVSNEESSEESTRKKPAVEMKKEEKVSEIEHVEKGEEPQGENDDGKTTKKGEKRKKHKKKVKKETDKSENVNESQRKKKKELNEKEAVKSGVKDCNTMPEEGDSMEEKKIVKEDEKKDTPIGKERGHIPWLDGCRSVEEFKCLNRIEEGAFGVVYRGKDKRTNQIVALKKVKLEKEREGFPITYIREINNLLKLRHPNIIAVREIVVGSDMDKIYIVMDYVEHDLKTLMEIMKKKKWSFTIGQVKCLMEQLLSAVQFLHDNWIMHRDLKPSNLLLSDRGILKVGDFGLAREYGSPLSVFTPIVVTLWYRAPELLLGSEKYSTPVDMWSIGCIFAELLTMKPLFPGEGEINQINLVYKGLGTPNDTTLPGFSNLPAVRRIRFPTYPAGQLRAMILPSLLSEQGFNLLNSFLTYDQRKRIKACNAKEHEYFDESPRAVSPSMFPIWPTKSESECSVPRTGQPGTTMNLIKASRFLPPGEGQ